MEDTNTNSDQTAVNEKNDISDDRNLDTGFDSENNVTAKVGENGVVDKFMTKEASDFFGLNDKQIEILKKFRENVQDVLKPKHDDYYLIRWLRARGFDLKKSEDMLRKHMDWRKEWGADTILDEWQPPAVLEQYYAGGLMGYSKNGSPIWVVESAQFDMKGLSLSVRRDDFLRFIIYIQEKLTRLMEEQTKKLGSKVHQAVFINDMSGFGMSHILQPGMDQLTKMMQTVEANYPEIMGSAYIINVPRVFPVMFNIMKPFMHENTKKKIRLLGRDYPVKLLEIIEPNILPKHWGGECVDENGDPRCSAKIPKGGKIPETFFLKPEDILGANSEVVTVTVSRGSHHDIPFTVKGKKILRWVFWTIKYDIKYTILYQENEGDKKQTVKKAERINAHVIPIDGFHNCDKPGIYTFRFDNGYSWIHSKEVHHSMHLVEVETNDAEVEGLKE